MTIIKTLRNLHSLLILISLIIFTSCSSNDKQIDDTELNEFKTKLVEFESNLTNINYNKSSNSSKISIDRETVESEINEYDYFGIQFTQFLLDLKEYIIVNEISDLDGDNLVQNYIETNLTEVINNLSPDNSNINEFEKLLFESFANKTDLDNVILYSKEYEKFVDENFSDVSQRKKLLSTISAYKWIGYELFYVNSDKTGASKLKSTYSNKIAIACSRRTGIEYCMCKRIESREADWNWVDTIGFLLTGPQQLAWDLAACTAAEF